MMNIRKSPMDMNTNRYEKLVQTPSRGAEGASPDCVAIEQCQSAYRQSMKTTVTEVYMNLADKPEPTRYQGTAVAAEGTGTDGTTNVWGRSIDHNNKRMTVMKLPTDCGKFTELISARVSPVVAETVHTDGTRVLQYQSDDQKSIKTTEGQMPMDYLEIPEPRLPRGFLDLAKEARNVKIESGRSWYMEEVQSQETGLTRPVFVTVMEYSSPGLQKGAVRATGVSTEMIQIMDSAGRCKPVDRSGLVGPQSKTEQPVLLSLDADQVGNAPAGPVGPDMKSTGRREPVDRSGLVGPQNKTEQPVLLGLDADQVGNAPAGPLGPDIMMDRIQPVAEGPVGQNNTRRPVGTEGMFLVNDSDRPTADGPVGRFITHSPVGPDRILSMCDPDWLVADGPVGRLLKVGPVGPKRMFSLDELNQPVAVGPVGQPFTTGPVGSEGI